MDLNQRRSGVLLHPTSLPGPHGVGDLGPAARHYVDWLVSAGQSLWQWLPSTPIGPGNSPYMSVSAFAGSPLMVALEPLVGAGWLAAPVLPEGGFDERQVEFAKVSAWRLAQLRLAAAGFFTQATPAQLEAWAQWRQANAYWLDDYALFMALETAHGGQPWWLWADALCRRKTKALEAARAEHAGEIAFWEFVQWAFDEQLAALKAYASERGVHLLGDLPIFIAHHSADCWARPDLYELDKDFQPKVVAGVPPDSMGPLGQRWGNPLYRWKRMAAEGHAWWCERMRRALTQASAVRIDHFRGFAGYYEIPASSATAQEGRWRVGPGRKLFEDMAQALGALPIIAEDLGFITPDVTELRDYCGFPGMKIVQFAFGGDATQEFLPHNMPPASVAYTGTHDNDTVQGWWQAASAHERAYAGAYLACGANDVHWAMIRATAQSVANTVVFPMQDVLGLSSEHRMNTPGTMGGANWAWRFEWSMVGSEPGRVLGLISAASGRGPFELLHLPPNAG